MIHNHKGFSFVELLISMVIFSIVTLFITSLLTTSNRMNSSTRGDNISGIIAKEKLIELQDAGGDSVSNGLDTISKNNKQFYLSWEIEKSTVPYKATINVTTDNDKGAIIVGYIVAGVCIDLGNANNSPSNIIFYDRVDSSTELTGSPVEVTIPLNYAINSPVIFFKGIDSDVANSSINDYLKYSITDISNSSGTNEFIISDDERSIETAANFTIGGEEYTITLKATDCSGDTITKDIKVSVSSNSVVLPSITLNRSSIDLNELFSGTLAEISTATHTTNISFATNSNDGRSIDGSFSYLGGYPPTSGNNYLNTTAHDFETGSHDFILFVIASNSDGNDTAELNVIIKDTNEAPTDISVTIPSFSEATPIGTDVSSLITIVDGDTADINRFTSLVEDDNISIDKSINDGSYFEINNSTGKLQILNSGISVGSHSIDLTAIDSDGLTLNKNFIFSVTPSGTPTSITLSSNAISEGNGNGDVIGVLTTTDNSTSGFTYLITAGNGSSEFDISGSNLIANTVFSYDQSTSSNNSKTITIQTTDPDNNTFSKNFTINILENANSSPCGTPTAVGSGTINNDGCYFHSGSFPAGTVIQGNYVEYYINGGSTKYLGSAIWVSSLPAQMDGGYYFEITKTYSTGYLTLP